MKKWSLWKTSIISALKVSSDKSASKIDNQFSGLIIEILKMFDKIPA